MKITKQTDQKQEQQEAAAPLSAVIQVTGIYEKTASSGKTWYILRAGKDNLFSMSQKVFEKYEQLLADYEPPADLSVEYLENGTWKNITALAWQQTLPF